jgi:citrate lyase subunit beta / citryl-CoA lyase
LRDFAAATRQLGYRGMMVIHPSHVPVVNEVFGPSRSEIDDWHAIIAQVEAGHADGVGTSTYKGRLIDAAHALTARDELERARAFGLV